MSPIYKFYLTFAILMFANLAFGQSATTVVSVKEETNNNSQKVLDPIQVQDNVSEKKDGEPALTPEEQGFTRFVENGKTFYRKENNGVVTEFIPEN